MIELVRVLIVDDSAYVRKVIRQMLSRSPFIEVVGAARDGRDALRLAEELKPDVITCDLIMPELDGVGFIREQMARRPVPIVVVSIASESGELVLSALDAGAVDFVQKPTALATDRLLEISDDLIEKVKGAARARPVAAAEAGVAPAARPSAAASHAFDIVVIGISTGGPQALKMLIPKLPAEFSVPIAIVLHMPVGYTELYARKLNEQSALTVVEAQGGEVVTPGHVYIAPAGRHLTLRRNGAKQVVTYLDVRPLDTPYRPSVDSLFHSAADVFGSRVLGIVMTGMGSDGREGSAWIKAKGGTVLTEAEASCVVYGMPRSIVEAGLSDAEVRLDQMADAMLERV
jgi:two-component system, chemotaxis family, protein-glutamate methylesterase/glutaminase